MRPARLPPFVVATLLALGAAAAFLAARSVTAGAQEPGEEPTEDELLETGEELFVLGCSSCHGSDGEGVTTPGGSVRGPSIVESGEAGAYYYVSTGRMPLSDSDDQPRRNRPAYNDAEIDALVAYVASLGDGPALPEVDVENANLARGGELYRATCAACHSAAGGGGALSYGRAAPSLGDSEPLQVGAAVRVGPGQMPVFGPDVLPPRDLDDVAAYVQYLSHPEDPGGLSLGRLGPIPEGFVAWFFGVGALVAFLVWIGTRAPVRRRLGSGR